MQFLPSYFQIPPSAGQIFPQHHILGKPTVCSLRLGPETTFHTHKTGLLVRNVEILNEPKVIHSKCRQLFFLYSVVVY